MMARQGEDRRGRNARSSRLLGTISLEEVITAVTGAIGCRGQYAEAESNHGACRSRRSVMMDINVFSFLTTG